MALPTTKLHTVDEFEEFLARPENRDRHFELIDGVIVEKTMPTEEHALIVGILLGELYIYARAHNIGLPGPEHRFRVPGDAQNVRQPDLSLTVETQTPITIKGATPTVPDVIAEVKSPDDTYDEMRDRAKFYITSGVRLVWLVFPRLKTVEVYRPSIPSDALTAEDSLDGYDVLPGFTLPVASLFVTTRGG